MAFWQPLRRFVDQAHAGEESPSAVMWSEFDRSALVRLPVVVRNVEGHAVTPPTVEFRLPDGSCHPHLLLAGVGQSGIRGRERQDLDALIKQTSTTAARSGTQQMPLPRSSTEIMEALAANRPALEAGEIFTSRLLDALVDDFESHDQDTRL